jgi:tetratricopeptide (TPR) repeat protein
MRGGGLMGISTPEDGAPRLESWKEIAAYLKRDVTTAQRWERQEGLPVHRLLHSRSGSVYAFAHELDAWRESRAAKPIDGPPPHAQDAPPGSSGRGWVVAAGAAAIVAVVSLSGWRLYSRPMSSPAPSSRPWVLIEPVRALGIEPSLADSLQSALDHGFAADAGVVSVVPRARIEETLRLMRLASDTRIDETVAREIGLRDERIRALASASISHVGAQYFVEVRVIRPGDGQTHAAVSETFSSPEQMIARMPRLVAALKERMPDDSADASRIHLERVTSASLHAVELYSRAYAFGFGETPAGWNAAEHLTRQALAVDPAFASAHNWLGWAIENQDHSKEDSLREFQRAVDLSDEVSDAERYFLKGTLDNHLERHADALGEYEALLKVQPDHYWAANNAAYSAGLLRDWSKLVQYRLRASDIKPDLCGPAMQAADRAFFFMNDLTTAQQYFDRAVRAAGRRPDGEPDWSRCPTLTARDRAFMRTFPVFAALARGDTDAAFDRVSAMTRSLSSYTGEERSVLTQNLADALMELGRLRQSVSLMQDTQQLPAMLYQAIAAYERGDILATAVALRAMPESEEGSLGAGVALLSRLGLIERAKRQVTRRKEHPLTGGLFEARLSMSQGFIDAAIGNTDVARGELEQGLTELNSAAVASSLGAQTLAQLFAARGDAPRAIRALEESRAARISSFMNGEGDLWLLGQRDLLDLYRRVGRDRDADALERELTHLLKYADEDHVVLRGLRRQTASRLIGWLN